MEQKGPVTYLIKNQLDNSIVQVHADQIRLANINEWPERKTVQGYPRRRANYVVPPKDSYDESDASDTERSNRNNVADLPASLNRIRQEHENSSFEDYIPLAQLRKRLHEQSREQHDQSDDSETSHSASDSAMTVVPSDNNQDIQQSSYLNKVSSGGSQSDNFTDTVSEHGFRILAKRT